MAAVRVSELQFEQIIEIGFRQMKLSGTIGRSKRFLCKFSISNILFAIGRLLSIMILFYNSIFYPQVQCVDVDNCPAACRAAAWFWTAEPVYLLRRISKNRRFLRRNHRKLSRLEKMHGVFYENCGIYAKIHRKLAAFPRKSENPQIAENRDYARHWADASIYPQHVDNLCKLLKFVQRVGKNAWQNRTYIG